MNSSDGIKRRRKVSKRNRIRTLRDVTSKKMPSLHTNPCTTYTNQQQAHSITQVRWKSWSYNYLRVLETRPGLPLLWNKGLAQWESERARERICQKSETGGHPCRRRYKAADQNACLSLFQPANRVWQGLGVSAILDLDRPGTIRRRDHTDRCGREIERGNEMRKAPL